MDQAQLQGADFTFAKLNGSVMPGAQLQGAKLDMVEQEGAFLNDVNLRGASLINARLAGSILENAELQGADLSYAHMQAVYLAKAGLQGAKLIGTRLTGTYVDEISVWGAVAKGDRVSVLTRWNGAEPKITNISPDASDVRLWAASMPDQNDEKAYIEWMLESKATDVQFFFFQADNVRTVKEIAEIVCSDNKWQTLSQISLETYLGSLMLLRRPAHNQLVTALNSGKCKNKSKFQKLVERHSS
jgi:uncharacterized protein YjbI with pentapeptide repeats